MKRSFTLLFVSLAALLACTSTQAAGKGKPGGGGGGAIPGNPAIVYMGGLGARGGSLMVMDADGANQRVLLLREKFMGISDPTWHPDGQKIVFTYGPNTMNRGRGIYQINLDGSGLRAIVPAPAYEGYYHALEQCDVSPLPGSNGKYRIAYRHRWPDNKGIFVVDEDGAGELVRVAPPNSSSPSWSPDGRHLAYVRVVQEASSDSFPNGRQFSVIELVTLAEDENGAVRPVSDVVLLDSESFGPINSRLAFSKTQNKIYFSAGATQDTFGLWALHLDSAMSPVAVQLLADGYVVRMSGTSDDSVVVYGSYVNDQAMILGAASDGSSAPTLLCIDGADPAAKR